MAKYDVIDLSEEGLYCIRELTTDKIIMASDSGKTAYRYVEKLNKGYGFDGWTPDFFIQDEMVV